MLRLAISAFICFMSMGRLLHAGTVSTQSGGLTIAFDDTTGRIVNLTSDGPGVLAPEGVPASGSSDWYCARITPEDGEMAWSSPVWVTGKSGSA